MPASQPHDTAHSDKENMPPNPSQPLPAYPAMPPRPDYGYIPPRPSDGWLKNPSFIDGGIVPPRMYYSKEEIEHTLAYWRPDPQPLGVTWVPMSQALAASPQSVPPAGTQADPAALPRAGIMLTVQLIYSVLEKPAGRGVKPVSKKKTVSKFDIVTIADLGRSDFVTAVLKIHDLHEQYSAGIHSGPGFRMWWTGSSGGKAGAATIDKDSEYEAALEAIGKKKKDAQVSVEFDLDAMEGFRIKKRPLVADTADENQELAHGTKVPRVKDFAEAEQLHGEIIIKLKSAWTCEKHQGEHGEPGHCYVDACGGHLGLNHRKLKIWAAAIAAHEATKHEPPNSIEFDGARDGHLTSIRPRGRNGPRSAVQSAPPGTDTSTLLVAAMIPFLTNLANNSATPNTPRKPCTPHPHTPRTPRKKTYSTATSLPSTPSHLSMPATCATPPSPIPKHDEELHSCLVDFLRLRRIDFLAFEDSLSKLDLTPDIIGDVPVERLCEITGAVEGKVRKLQRFCSDWIARLEEKRRISL